MATKTVDSVKAGDYLDMSPGDGPRVFVAVVEVLPNGDVRIRRRDTNDEEIWCASPFWLVADVVDVMEDAVLRGQRKRLRWKFLRGQPRVA